MRMLDRSHRVSRTESFCPLSNSIVWVQPNKDHYTTRSGQRLTGILSLLQWEKLLLQTKGVGGWGGV